MDPQPSSARRREERWRAGCRVAGRAAHAVALAAALVCLAPAEAVAQRAAFVEAFVAFHSRLIGTYGDEGPRIAASLDAMASTLAEWERQGRAAEAELKSHASTPAGDFAVLYLDAGRLDAALRAMDAAIEAEPRRAAFHRLRALILEALGRQPDAVAALAAAWEIDPDDPIGAYLLADRRIALDATADVAPQVATLIAAFERMQSAADRPSAPFVELTLVDDFSADTPIFSPVLYAEGLESFARGRYKEAIARFRDALSRDPLTVDPALRSDPMVKGIAALRSGRAADAIPYLEAAVAASPNSAEAHRIAGTAHRANGDDTRSVEHLEAAVRLAPGDERARVALGRALMDAGRHEQAETALRATLEKLPASGEARWALADLYETMGRLPDAIAAIEAATSLTVIAGKGHLYWRLARLLHRHQDYEGVAIALANRGRLALNEPIVHKDLGLAYTRLGRQDHALVALLLSAIIGVEDAETLAAIGQIHLDARRYPLAERVLRRAVAMQPDLPQAQYALGTTLIRLGQSDEGKQHLSEFQRLRAAALERQQRSVEGGALTGAQPPVPEPEK